MPTTFESIINLLLSWGGEIIAALVGAFVGAGAAFWLQRRREDQLKADKEYAAIIKAQHALLFMWRIVASIRYTQLDNQRAVIDRHRKLPQFWMPDRDYAIDLDSLAFLFRPTMRELLSNCFYAERGYLSAMDAIETRNESLAAVLAQGGDVTYSDQQIPSVHIAHMDPVKEARLKSATDALYNTVDRGMASCEKAFAELRRSALTVFPDRNFLKDDNLTEEAIKRDLAALGIITQPTNK